MVGWSPQIRPKIPCRSLTKSRWLQLSGPVDRCGKSGAAARLARGGVSSPYYADQHWPDEVGDRPRRLWWQMVEHQGGHHEVEPVIAERQLRAVPLDKSNCVGVPAQSAPGDPQHSRIGVDADVMGPRLGGDERLQQCAGAAPEVEHVLAGRHVGDPCHAGLERLPEAQDRGGDVVQRGQCTEGQGRLELDIVSGCVSRGRSGP